VAWVRGPLPMGTEICGVSRVVGCSSTHTSLGRTGDRRILAVYVATSTYIPVTDLECIGLNIHVLSPGYFLLKASFSYYLINIM